MKKIINIGIAFVFIALLGLVGYYLWQHEQTRDTRPRRQAEAMPPPPRITELGFSTTGINSTDIQGDLEISVAADRLSFAKTKTFGFDNALMKKIAATNFQLRIRKAGRQIFYARKDRLTLPLNLETIVIFNPQEVFPSDLGHPDEIRLDKKNKRLHIRQGQKTVVWNLATM